MNREEIVVIKEIDVRRITLTVCVLGLFWGGFWGSIGGYIIKGIIARGMDLVIKAGILGSVIGLGIGFGTFVLAVSYNLLAGMGYGLKVRTHASIPSPENQVQQ